MNRIYWSENRVAMLNDIIDTKAHKHWMLQLFLSLEGDLELEIEGTKVTGKCIVVDQDVPHAFFAHNKVHFSILFDPSSEQAKQMKKAAFPETNYQIYTAPGLEALQQEASQLMTCQATSAYINFSRQLFKYLGITPKASAYDPRIFQLFHLLDTCDCTNHSLSHFASKLALSPSRLAHLFKQEVGVPLKSYLVLHKMMVAYLALFQGNSITDAALSAGFDSPSHLAATTQKMIGMPAGKILKDSEFLKVYNL